MNRRNFLKAVVAIGASSVVLPALPEITQPSKVRNLLGPGTAIRNRLEQIAAVMDRERATILRVVTPSLEEIAQFSVPPELWKPAEGGGIELGDWLCFNAPDEQVVVYAGEIYAAGSGDLLYRTTFEPPRTIVCGDVFRFNFRIKSAA